MTLETTKALRCGQLLKDSGFDFFTGVACSLLAGLIEELSEEEPRYIPAVREDLAVGLASGAFLAGRWPVVLMQNSGLGYCLNVLTSLNLIYKIPLLLVVGFRGYQGKDAPEHRVMGRHCQALLQEIGMPVFLPGQADLGETFARAFSLMQQKQIPAAVLIRPGVLERVKGEG